MRQLGCFIGAGSLFIRSCDVPSIARLLLRYIVEVMRPHSMYGATSTPNPRDMLFYIGLVPHAPPMEAVWCGDEISVEMSMLGNSSFAPIV